MSTSGQEKSKTAAGPAASASKDRGPILVTGGTGFLGEHLLRALRGSGQPVRVLCREPTPELAELGVSVYQGDLVGALTRTESAGSGPRSESIGDDDALAAALDGVREVYHLAGMVSRDPERAQTMMQLHVDGTRRLLHAAKAAGVRRVLLASTSGTIAISRDPEPIPDETFPYPVELCGNWPYYLSKIYQEKLALDLAPKLGLELVVVNPSLLLGPGDRRGSSTGDVRRFLCGEIPVIPSGGLSFVDARDVAATCLVAMEKGRRGALPAGRPQLDLRRVPRAPGAHLQGRGAAPEGAGALEQAAGAGLRGHRGGLPPPRPRRAAGAHLGRDEPALLVLRQRP
ncbi:MAG TPA: NAD-dependent epimerase/dehydratase family protein, partial [Pseudomonadota bacterium]|nr:NAD-dependent epimerase/dehydratase family protein [Pseudomonadota bacterium]